MASKIYNEIFCHIHPKVAIHESYPGCCWIRGWIIFLVQCFRSFPQRCDQKLFLFVDFFCYLTHFKVKINGHSLVIQKVNAKLRMTSPPKLQWYIYIRNKISPKNSMKTSKHLRGFRPRPLLAARLATGHGLPTGQQHNVTRAFSWHTHAEPQGAGSTAWQLEVEAPFCQVLRV